MKNKYNVQSVSFTDRELLQAARNRASNLGLSLSKYVNLLIKKDISAKNPEFVIEEDSATYTHASPDNEPKTY